MMDFFSVSLDRAFLMSDERKRGEHVKLKHCEQRPPQAGKQISFKQPVGSQKQLKVLCLWRRDLI